MVTTVLVVLMILALLEIVLLNGARLFFMIVSASAIFSTVFSYIAFDSCFLQYEYNENS